MGEVTAWVAIAVSVVVGGASVILAGLANSRAKKANRIAQHANQLAAEAVGQAREANQIAENANHLSEEANTLIRRQAAQLADPAHIEWHAEWDAERTELVVTNTGRDEALNVSVLVKGYDIDHLEQWPSPVSRGEQVSIAFPEIRQRRLDSEAAIAKRRAEARAAGDVHWPTLPFFVKVRIDVRWRTEVGRPEHQVIEFRLG